MIKVKAGNNVRDLDLNGIDLDIRKGREIEIIPRYLKSLDFRKCLFTGVLRVCEGVLEFRYKSTMCSIDSEFSNIVNFIEDGKEYTKDLDTSEILLKVEEEEEEKIMEEEPKKEKIDEIMEESKEEDGEYLF